ncbi:MAG TPA: MFS transporter [Gemmatimonadaceae bacterium]
MTASPQHAARDEQPAAEPDLSARPRYKNPIAVLLRHRNFRLFWLGQTGSVIGTWMQSVARGWLALQLTNSPFMVGFVSAAGSLPVLVLTLYAGVVADRHEKLRMVKVTQSLLLVEATLLWWFDWSGHITIVWLVVISLLGGTFTAFDIPARQALMVELVGREDVVDAIALNSSGFNLARIIGPSVAAIVIAKWGLAWCFGLNALSFLLVELGLFMIRLPPWARAAAVGSPMEGLVEGLRYMWRTREVRLLMSVVAVYSIFGIPYLVLMPVIARDTLHSGAQGYGILLAAVGVGAVAGAVSLAMAGHTLQRGRLLRLSTYFFCAFLVLFSLSRSLWLSSVLLLAVGLTMIVNNALANGLLQTIAPDELRGRVMAAYAFVFVGMGPIGSLLAGGVADVVGAPAAIAIGAAVMLLFVWWMLGRRRELHHL